MVGAAEPAAANESGRAVEQEVDSYDENQDDKVEMAGDHLQQIAV